MTRYRISLVVLLTALAAGLLFWQRQAQSRPQIRKAANSSANTVSNGSAAPGQLAILDKKGQPKGNCPLKHTDVHIDVAGYVSRVTVTQEFNNPTSEPIEALYTFPLPSDAAVDDMTMFIGKRVIRSQILKREEAREVYEAAKSNGQAAALLDQERPNIFTQSVANILPGETVKITIRYVNLLKYQDGWYELVFPMVVGPRYIAGSGAVVPGQRPNEVPAVQQTGDSGSQAVVTDGDKISPPITPQGTRAGHDISLSVRLDAGIPIKDIRSTLHAVTIEPVGETRAVISLKDQKEIPNKDFILRYTAAGSDMVSGVLVHAVPLKTAPNAGSSAANGYFTLVVQPPAAAPRDHITPKEMIFVIDQTGSQQGWPIAKAKETMRHCIQNLNPGDTFQLLGFNTALYPCFPAPVPATEATIATALKFLEPIEGNGGTDILKSVEYALKIPEDLDRLRIICYMTDGYVGNDMQILDCVQKNRGSARMFPFGCGNSVNRFLIDGMAREGRGVSEYVTLQSNGSEAAARFYHRVADPLLLDISVDWNGLPVTDVYPKHIPDVFSAQPILIKGRYTQAAEGDITIHGMLRGKPWSQKVHIQLPALKNNGEEIKTLWAREKLEDLQNQDWLGTQKNQPDPNIHTAIVNTALEYRLMSQYTSFVAVEQKVINAGGKTRTLDVPVEMPEGVSYEGITGNASKLDRLSRTLGVTRATPLNRRTDRMMTFSGDFFSGVRSKSESRANGSVPPPPAQSAATLNKGYAGAPGNAAKAPESKPRKPGDTTAAKEEKQAAGKKLSLEQEAVRDKEKDAAGVLEFDGEAAASGEPAALKALAKLKPEQRAALLAQYKLAGGLQGLAALVKKEGKNGSLKMPGRPEVVGGRVEVQIRLNSLPPKALQQLKALGFELEAALEPGKLLLGTADVSRLNTLIELPWIRRIELPRFH